PRCGVRRSCLGLSQSCPQPVTTSRLIVATLLISTYYGHLTMALHLLSFSTASCQEVSQMRMRAIMLMSVGLALFASGARADTADRKDLQVFNDVATSVNRYAHFTIFDDVNAQVKDGVVTLTG